MSGSLNWTTRLGLVSDAERSEEGLWDLGGGRVEKTEEGLGADFSWCCRSPVMSLPWLEKREEEEELGLGLGRDEKREEVGAVSLGDWS